MMTVSQPLEKYRARGLVSALLILCLAFMVFYAPSARAQGAIRDAEMEAFLRDIGAKIMKAAGIPAKAVRVVVINDTAFNAFVMNHETIFINTGTILDSERPEELMGVIAHETGHLTGGHLARIRERMKSAQTLTTIGSLVGILGGVAASRNGNVEGSRAAIGVMYGSQELAFRLLRSYQREEEIAADRAAVTIFNTMGISPKFIQNIFKRLASNSLRLSKKEAYTSSHPTPADRISRLALLVDEAKNKDAGLGGSYQERFDLVKAKIAGFLLDYSKTANLYRNDNSLAGRYAMAIATANRKGYRQASKQIDSLISERPSNPYFRELKGQLLLESGNPKEAVPVLKKALDLSNNSPLISVLYAQALLARGGSGDLKSSQRILNRALARDKNLPDALFQLSLAYGRQGRIGEADLALAKLAAIQGEPDKAKTLARRAQTRLKRGGKEWVEAEDIVQSLPQAGRVK